MSLALQFNSVRAGYGQLEALHGVDLSVPTGKVVALIGANGAGKSTLLRVAAGLQPITQGTVFLGGEDITGAPSHHRSRRGLCLIPEGRGIFRQLSVRENLAVFAERGQSDMAVERAASMFSVLGNRLDQLAGTLSGGEQQMLAVARALVSRNANVILADELSVGLAPIIVDEIFGAIDVLRAEHRSLIIVEQYVNRVLAFADYVYILHKGNVVFVGEPAQCEDHGIFERYMGSVA